MSDPLCDPGNVIGADARCKHSAVELINAMAVKKCPIGSMR